MEEIFKIISGDLKLIKQWLTIKKKVILNVYKICVVLRALVENSAGAIVRYYSEST